MRQECLDYCCAPGKESRGLDQEIKTVECYDRMEFRFDKTWQARRRRKSVVRFCMISIVVLTTTLTLALSGATCWWVFWVCILGLVGYLIGEYLLPLFVKTNDAEGIVLLPQGIGLAGNTEIGVFLYEEIREVKAHRIKGDLDQVVIQTSFKKPIVVQELTCMKEFYEELIQRVPK